MAQAGSAQREPSMEEILASIRRIIEDSDLGRKPDEGIDAVRADNDANPPPQMAAAETEPKAGLIPPDGEPSAPPPVKRTEPAKIIDVEAFRAELRSDSAIGDSPRSVTLADVQARVEADRGAARAVTEADLGGPVSLEFAPEPPAPATAAVAREPVNDWRLGVSPPQPQIPVAGAAKVADRADARSKDMADAIADIDDFELDLSDFDSISAHADTVTDGSESEPPFQPSRPALISDEAGKKVAAAFGELSDAFAARSRKNLDEMAEDMLRPLLQDWLDNNLPLMVERLVREEIERIARA